MESSEKLPRSRGGGVTYREGFWEWPLEKRHREMHASEFCVTQDEVVFDAADISRFGRDLLVQESMTTNRPGIRWLKRHLEPRGFRVHPVHFPLDFFPSHIGCTFVLLRPGLVLTNPDRPLRKGEEAERPLQELLDRLGFEVLPLPFRDVFEYGGSLHCATWDVNREGAARDYFPRAEYRTLAEDPAAGL
ncbi:hypothetical protein [Streptomyces katsurahamanus]|uniref:hypothetical protein n=1 Tax=Streptomyces katsurahamanus TaxID=2577098 RepID=UPI001E52110C|nr:hypothetical protein [Streptomyces katsurahamanus]